jgi:DNA polymerase III epsilon subunit-like protein
MKKKYISVDIEASGNTAGKYSMLSLGACVVGNISEQFYKEIKPINRNYSIGAMKVSSKGLKCLENLKHKDEYNPKSDRFNPEKVLDILQEKGETPEEVMKKFAEWIKKITKGFEARESAAPIKFDGGFTSYYFDNFYNGKNPLGYSGEDINSMYKGVMKDLDAHIAQLGLRGKELPHNALEDAIIQAKEFEKVLELMNEINKI